MAGAALAAAIVLVAIAIPFIEYALNRHQRGRWVSAPHKVQDFRSWSDRWEWEQ